MKYASEQSAGMNSLPDMTVTKCLLCSGVGYSYSDDQADYNNTGDFQTISDLHATLTIWFQKYHSFQDQPFFLWGASYAGKINLTISESKVPHCTCHIGEQALLMNCCLSR